MIHYASFRHDGENYLAFGVVKDYLPVFVEGSHGQYFRHGRTRWPSWAKFMHGDVDNYEEGTVSDLEELERRYGSVPADAKAAIAEDMRNSRWTDNPFTPPDASPELLEWYDKRDEAIRIWRKTGDDTMAIEIGLFPSKEELEEMEASEELGPKVSALKELEADPELTRLDDMLSEFDALEVLGVSRRENTHSNVLAWLLNPQGSHMLGAYFLKEFLRETKTSTDVKLEDQVWLNTRVLREWHSVVDEGGRALDILVLNEDAKFACAIENKVLSGEQGGQLTSYRKALEANYPGFDASHLFLTRYGDHAKCEKERKFWKPVRYGLVLRLVEKMLKDGPSPDNDEVIEFLRQYEKTLRRRIVPETEMRRTANNLYLKHRAAIDLIIRQREAHIAGLSRICREVATQKTNWKEIGERSRGKLLGFVDPQWKEHDVLWTGTTLGKQSKALLVLDFDFRVFGEVRLLLTIMRGSDENIRERLYKDTQERFPRVFNHRGAKNGGRHREQTIRLYVSEPILSGTDFIEGDRESWRKAISDGVRRFVDEEFSEMNKIICNSLGEIKDT